METAAKGKADCLPAKGDLYWNLPDDLEWQMGYAAAFSLTGADRTAKDQHPKGSLFILRLWR